MPRRVPDILCGRWNSKQATSKTTAETIQTSYETSSRGTGWGEGWGGVGVEWCVYVCVCVCGGGLSGHFAHSQGDFVCTHACLARRKAL